MNKTLAIYVEEDYLIAGIEPLHGKFQHLTKRGNPKFPFYFFIDKLNNKVDYSFVYKSEYETQYRDITVDQGRNERIIGDFVKQITDKNKFYKYRNYEVELINLLVHIIDDIKSSYYERLRKIGDIDENKSIPVDIAFSDNIGSESQSVIKNFIAKQNLEIKRSDLTMSQLIVKSFLDRGKIDGENKKYAVIEALSDNLNISIICLYNEFDRERSHFKSFHDFGVDPRIKVIAEKIVDDIDKQAGLLSNDEQRKQEYKRHYILAEKLSAQIESQNIPYLQVETTFSVEPDRKRTTNLAIKDIERETSIYIRQISRSFEGFMDTSGFQTQEIEKIFLIGSMLSNELVKKEFNRFGHTRLHYLDEDDTTLVLSAMLSKGNKTSAKSKDDGFDYKPLSQYQKVDYLTLSTLKPEQKVKLSNNDATPGKGTSVQELKYLGINKFIVIKSTRSLIAGDFAIAITPVWVPGMQPEFDIERNGKRLGKFRTRNIVQIEIQ